MTALRILKPSTPSLDAVFDRLLSDIVSGRYVAGAHLPPERDLARQLGASRATLREALRRLGEWRLIEARRGSGVVVRPTRDWTLGALAAHLRHQVEGGRSEELAALARDLLAIRRILLLDIVRFLGPRLRGGSLDAARAALRRAWDAREDTPTFVHLDFDVLRTVAEAAAFLPATWLLTGLVAVYEPVARVLSGITTVPDVYVPSYDEVMDALEAGRIEHACYTLSRYFDLHDARLLAALRIAA